MFRLFTDGGSRGNPGEAACACFLFENETLVAFDSKYLGTATNNYAEYSGLLLGLDLAHKNKVYEVECFLDSELVVKQVKGEYKVNNADIRKMIDKFLILSKKFKKVNLNHVPRAQNKHADRLVNLVLDCRAG